MRSKQCGVQSTYMAERLKPSAEDAVLPSRPDVSQDNGNNTIVEIHTRHTRAGKEPREQGHEQRRLLAQRNISSLTVAMQGILCFLRLMSRIRSREELELKAFKTVHMKVLETTSAEPKSTESGSSAQPYAQTVRDEEATTTQSSDTPGSGTPDGQSDAPKEATESLFSDVEDEQFEDASSDLASLHDTASTDDGYHPLPPGTWTVPFHGNCPRCRHHHRRVEVRIAIAQDRSQAAHIRCERCNEKWAVFGSSNTTQISLLSASSTDPDVNDRELPSVHIPNLPGETSTSYTNLDGDVGSNGQSRPSRSKKVLSWLTNRGRINKNIQVKAN